MLCVLDLIELTIAEAEHSIQKIPQVDGNDQEMHGMKTTVITPQAQVDVIKFEVGVTEIKQPN